MTHEQTIYAACALAAWWIVPHFVKPFDYWRYTFHMQAVGTVAFFIYMTSTLPESSPNYTPFRDWLLFICIGVAVYSLYQFVNEQKGT